MDSILIFAATCIILLITALTLLCRTTKHLPKLSVEVLECKHGTTADGSAFLLQMNCRVRNIGNRNTTITGLEAHLVDAQNKLQQKILTLRQEVDAGKNPASLEMLFLFVPPFPYVKNIVCHFILYHTYGREVFVANSVSSDMKE